MTVNIFKIAFVNTPYSDAYPLAKKVTELWCTSNETKNDSTFLIDIDRPLKNFLNSYTNIPDNDGNVEIAFRELRRDKMKNFEKRAVDCELKLIEELIQNNVTKNILIIMINITCQSTVEYIKSKGFTCYRVINENQNDIIKSVYNDIGENDIKSLIGFEEIPNDLSLITLKTSNSIKKEALNLVLSILLY